MTAADPKIGDASAGHAPPSYAKKASRQWWGSIPEVGSLAALRFLVTLYRLFGRRACLLVVHVVALYFSLLAGAARRASRQYLDTLWKTERGREALGHAPGFRDVLHHIHEFSINIFDRLVAWSGQLGSIRFTHRGSEVLFDLAESGSGAFLIGAHQGSFDMMRLLADKYEMTVNVLMFTKHATRINTFFEQLDPSSRVRVLEIEPSSLKTAFVIRECIARGEFVGILADRIHPGARDRPVYLDFLGRPTPFSLSPFVLASVIGCPVVHTQCIRLDDSTYESSARVISEGIDPKLPRRRKAELLLRAYVAGIEETCYRAPYQWFNFYDYWSAIEPQGDASGDEEAVQASGVASGEKDADA
jgi:predicted LPLAT superfamily acyltransferase